MSKRRALSTPENKGNHILNPSLFEIHIQIFWKKSVKISTKLLITNIVTIMINP